MTLYVLLGGGSVLVIFCDKEKVVGNYHDVTKFLKVFCPQYNGMSALNNYCICNFISEIS